MTAPSDRRARPTPTPKTYVGDFRQSLGEKNSGYNGLLSWLISIGPRRNAKAAESGRSAGVARSFGVGEVGGSNPPGPTQQLARVGNTNTSTILRFPVFSLL